MKDGKGIKYGKDVIYGVCIVLYLIGLLLLLDILFRLQNLTFNNSYYSLLYPLLGMFILGSYISLVKLFKKMIEPNVKIKIRSKNKMLYLMLGIIFLLLLSMKFNFNPYNLATISAFFGYVISLISGFQLIKVIEND